LDYAPGRGHHHPLKTESSDNSYMDMSDFFGDSSTAVAVAAAMPLHNGGLYPVAPGPAVPMSGVEFSDLSHDTMLGGRAGLLSHGLHPLSNASLGSRASEEDGEDGASAKASDMSDLGKAFTVMNDDFHYN
jgi:hypothetical protein